MPLVSDLLVDCASRHSYSGVVARTFAEKLSMRKVSFILGACVALMIASCGSPSTEKKEGEQAATNSVADQQLLAKAKGLFAALPATAENPENPVTPEKVLLGKQLYFDTHLSMKGNNSCNSCHSLSTFGVDNLPFSKGDNGGFGTRNSPTVFNAALHSMQFWDGRAKDVEEQAGGPITNPVEMAMPNKALVEKRLKGMPEYVTMFKAAFPADKVPVTYLNVQKAIGAFERTLLTPAPFDKYMNGDLSALNAEQKEGMNAFIDAGCTTCHLGSNLGGTMMMKFGLVADYHPLTGSKTNDNGKMDLTKQEGDKDIFKVPGLRNIAKTQPYFHDGSVADLGAAVKIMAKVQFNKDLTDKEVKSMVAFLESLTGDLPADVKAAPKVIAEK